MHRLAVAALALALAAGLTACSKKPGLDIPSYPGSSQVSSTENVETDAGTLFRIRRATPDTIPQVAKFYETEMGQRGWKKGRGLGPTFTDGNIKVDWQGNGPGVAEPIDPTRTGGQVTVYGDSQKTFIIMWQFIPKAE